MSDDTIETLKTALENSRYSQSGVDRKNAELQAQVKELTSQLEKMKGYAGGEERILARLDMVEKMGAEERKALALSYHARVKCLENGVDYALIADMNFKDAAQIEAKIAQLTTFIKDRTTEGVIARLGETTPPQSGITPSPPTPYQNMIQKTMQGMNKK
jgi:hypothetical protein